MGRTGHVWTTVQAESKTNVHREFVTDPRSRERPWESFFFLLHLFF
jgi:hypothetical protein